MGAIWAVWLVIEVSPVAMIQVYCHSADIVLAAARD
jgi:hypothetical protein